AATVVSRLSRSFVQHLLRHDLTCRSVWSTPGDSLETGGPPRYQPCGAGRGSGPHRGYWPTRASWGARSSPSAFLYDAGARVSEALAVHPQQLRLERPQQVRLHGKG